MKKINFKIYKFLVAIIVFCTIFLYTTISPDSEETASTLTSFFSYNTVPYLDNNEVSIVYNKSDDAIDAFIGTVTAYGPDCVGCVSGLTSTGYRVGEVVDGTVKSTTITYNDSEYGKVRILAAAPNKFAYGTIIRITGPRIDGEILGIVIDTGIAMRQAWHDGEILIDLLFPSERNQEVYDFGRQRNVLFEVLRYGY